MAFSAAAQVGALDIGSVLKIVSTNGVYNQLSEESDMWKMILKMKTALPEGRQIQYLLQDSYGPAAVQNLPRTAGDFPAAQRVGLQEGIAYFKDYGLTIEVQNTIMNKALSEMSAYEKNVLQMEIDAKIMAAARQKSAELYGDGTGVIGIISGTPTISGGKITVTLNTATANNDRSHIGWMEEKDHLKIYTSAGVSHNEVNGGTAAAYFQIDSIDEDNDQVVLAAYNSSGAQITITSLSGSDVADGDYMVRKGENNQDWSAISTSNDYANVGYALVGLGSLSQNDGRLVNAITHNASIGGTRNDVNGAQIDSKHFQSVLSKVKRRVGKNRYQYKFAFMWDEVYDALLEQSETDRRFQTLEDGTRGFKKLGYQHGKNFVEFVTDEFCPKKRIYLPPESKEVLEFRGTDFEFVEPNKGQRFHLANASSGQGHARAVQAYMEGSGLLLTRHSKALAVIEDFVS